MLLNRTLKSVSIGPTLSQFCSTETHFFHNQVCGELILYPEHIPNDISLYTDSFQPPTKNYYYTIMKRARHNTKNLRYFIRFSELCPICLY